MTIEVVMRTADRGVRPPYVATTVAALAAQGVPPERMHLCPTSPRIDWLDRRTVAAVALHVPDRPLLATENMGVALSRAPRCAWVLHLEDDVTICRDFLGSVERWLTAHASDSSRLVSFFLTPRMAAGAIPVVPGRVAFPVASFHTAVAFALRWEDAQACSRWVTAHAPGWRTGGSWPGWAHKRGSDRMVGAWHQEAYPRTTHGIASVPCFVEHAGHVSSLRHIKPFRFARASQFTGEAWP